MEVSAVVSPPPGKEAEEMNFPSSDNLLSSLHDAFPRGRSMKTFVLVFGALGVVVAGFRHGEW